MIVVPFIPAHLIGLNVHTYMGYMQEHLNNKEYAEALAQHQSFTGIKDGNVLGCAGIVQYGINRWVAWALLSDTTGKHMLRITRAIEDFLNDNPKPRIETHVRRDFPQGHKLMRVLGFYNETPNGMKNYGEDGMTYDLYARVA